MKGAHQEPLERSMVDFGYEDLDTKAGCYQSTQNCGSANGKGDLQQLPLQPFCGREHGNSLSRNRIRNLFLMFEVFPPRLNLRDPTDAPPHCQVHLLMFPVFGENNAPQRADDGIHWRKVAEHRPRTKTSSSGECKKGEVGLGKGEVESNLEHPN